MTKKRSPGEGLGRTWRWNLDSGSHNLGHIWSYKALLSLLVTIGLRKSTGSETSSELFCFRKKKIVKPPHRMETLGRRCKPLGSVSSWARCWSQGQRKRKEFHFETRVRVALTTVPVSIWCQWGEESSGHGVKVPVLLLLWWIWLSFRVFSVRC